MNELIEKYYTRALTYLSRRPRSSKEIRDYLTKKKVDPDIIEPIIDLLIKQKFLNDKDFARWWRDQRTRFRAKSDRMISMELKSKGIDPLVIKEIFEEETDEPMDDLTKAKKLVSKRMKRVESLPVKLQYEKLGRYLLSKGFDWNIIRKAIDDVLEKTYNDDK